ncbi:MAG: hypothetical protein ACI8UO_005700, partial [Verrucomicrobiales bacterium]
METTFGIIKEVMGFRGFSLRGLEKVTGEWKLVCLNYNCKRLHNLKRAAEARPNSRAGVLSRIAARLAAHVKIGSSGNIVAAESIVVECMNEKPRPSLCFVTGIG